MHRIALFLAALSFTALLLFVARPAHAPARAAPDGRVEPEQARERPAPVAGGTALDDTTGEAVPEAKVTLYRVADFERETTLIATAIADAAGRLASTLPGRYGDLVVIDAKGYPLQAQEYDEAHIPVERGTDRTCKIVDESGAPAAAAEIDLFADRWSKVRLGHAVADAEGRVTLRVAGVAWLLVRHPGHSYVRTCIHPRNDRELPDSFTLHPEFTVGGQVLDSAGKPLPGAEVGLTQRWPMGSGDAYDMTLVAGPHGGFLFRGALDLDGSVRAQRAGYEGGSVHVLPGDEHVRIVLRRTAAVSGVVAMPDGRPAAGVEVGFRYDRTVETDAEGRFRLEGLAPTRHELRATGKLWEGSAHVEPEEGEEIVDLRIVLGPIPRSYVRVRVTDARGSPMEGVRIHGWPMGLGDTDATGTATLACGVAAGTEVRISGHVRDDRMPLGHDLDARTRTFGSVEEAEIVDLVVCEPVLVRLDARAPDGDPIPDAWGLFPGDVCYGSGERWLDPNEEYTIPVGARGYLSQSVKWRPRDAGTVLTVTLEPAAAIRGRFVAREGMPEEIRVWSDLGEEADAMPGPDGSFLVGGLREGKRTFCFGPPREVPEARIEVTTTAGQVTDVGAITLVPEVALTGRVLGPAGDPIGGALVELRTGIPGNDAETHSRADGMFRIAAPVFAGSHVVIVRRGFGAIRAAVPEGPSRAIGDLAMTPCGSAHFDFAAIGAKEASLTLSWADDPAIPVDRESFAPKAVRSYRNDGLAPGRYVARLRVGTDTLRREFTVTEGRTTEVTFTR